MPCPIRSCGIEIHRKTNTLRAMDVVAGQIPHPLATKNTPGGGEALANYLCALANGEGYDACRISAEGAGLSWGHFPRSLDRDPFLNQRSEDLYPCDPRLGAKLRKAFGNQDEADPSDAFVVADRLRMVRICVAPSATPWSHYPRHHPR